MNRNSRLITALGLLLPGCFRISINPQCPDEMQEGQTGALVANEDNAGAIADYSWVAEPAARATIDNASRPDTTFVAERSGRVTFTLTASDGLFQMVDSCTTQVREREEPEPEPDLTVNLVANPETVTVQNGEASTLLTCTNTGSTSGALTIDQLDGTPVELTSAVPGISVAVFPPTAGSYTFRCIGTDEEGNRSEPSVVQVRVQTSTRPPR